MNPQTRTSPGKPRSAAVGATAMTLTVAAAFGAEEPWEERFAESFSSRLREIPQQLASLEAELRNLPAIPINDQGGSGGFALIHSAPSPVGDSQFAIQVSWEEPAEVDMVAMVPARRYDARGRDAQYGMPDAFTVELTDETGALVRKIAMESGTRGNPVRNGHPFVYPVEPPVAAAGLRIVASGLASDPDNEGMYVHAWSEVFVFTGERNLGLGAQVLGHGGVSPSAPWLWAPGYLVDGQTPLGLPEVPTDEEHRNVGWLSNSRTSAIDSVALTIDLGEPREFDRVRLLPARRPTNDLPSGFGFPRRLALAVSETGAADSWERFFEGDFRNPGHNPVEIPTPGGRGRHLKVEAVELWKEFDSYPAFFALSEVEILADAENLALGRPVRSPDGMLNIIAPGGRYWSGAALSDGFGPDGKLVPLREWLTLLDKRLALETRRHNLLDERRRLIARWRTRGLALFALLAAAGAFTIVALPIRYRIRARREVEQVRERIAGDLHDEVGSNLGSIQMFANLSEDRSGPSEELKRIQRIAAETVSAVRDIVWLLRPGGDHRIGTVEHLRETSSIMLESLDWNFHANEQAWLVELPEERTRHLFLFFREAIHNILRHARAEKVAVDVTATDQSFHISIHDDGTGIDSARLERPATLRALRQRAEALAADLQVESKAGQGTRLILDVPLHPPKRHRAKPGGFSR